MPTHRDTHEQPSPPLGGDDASAGARSARAAGRPRARWPRSRRGERVLVGGVGAAAVVIALAGVAVLVLQTTATPLNPDEQLARFRAEQRDRGEAPGAAQDADGSAATTSGAGQGEPDGAAAPGTAEASATAPTAEDDAPREPNGGERQDPEPAGAEPAEPEPSEPGAHEPAATEAAGQPETDEQKRAEPTADVHAIPPEGIYTYDTEGGESISARGGERTYPEETTITVWHAGCGVVTRWDVVEERWDEDERCVTDDGLTFRHMTSYREFFGFGNEEALVCEPGTPARPASYETGERFTIQCSSEENEVRAESVVLGRQVLEVGGERVETVHTRSEGRIRGETNGQRVTERWTTVDTGVVVQVTDRTEATTQGPFGEVDYEEAYTLRLQSLQPRR